MGGERRFKVTLQYEDGGIVELFAETDGAAGTVSEAIEAAMVRQKPIIGGTPYAPKILSTIGLRMATVEPVTDA